MHINQSENIAEPVTLVQINQSENIVEPVTPHKSSRFNHVLVWKSGRRFCGVTGSAKVLFYDT